MKTEIIKEMEDFAFKMFKLENPKTKYTNWQEVDDSGDWESLQHQVFEMCEGDIYIPKTPEEYEEYNKLSWAEQKEFNKQLLLEKLGYKHISQDGGGEGGSEYCEGIFELNGKFYSASYQYYSHNGHEFDDILDTLVEVFPVQKTITVYEAKNN